MILREQSENEGHPTRARSKTVSNADGQMTRARAVRDPKSQLSQASSRELGTESEKYELKSLGRQGPKATATLVVPEFLSTDFHAWALGRRYC